MFESAKVTKIELILSYTKLIGPNIGYHTEIPGEISAVRPKIGRRTDIPVSAINQVICGNLIVHPTIHDKSAD